MRMKGLVRACVRPPEHIYYGPLVVDILTEGETCHVNLVYEVDPDVCLLWVFRSIDAAVWGDAMWENNENVVDVAEVIGEDREMLLVMENINDVHMLKFLTHDTDVREWRVYLMLHEDRIGDEQSVLEETSDDTGSSDEPPLDEDNSVAS
jgi:hypothetical protein